MKTQEINPAGNFKNWDVKLLSELKKGKFTTQVGEKLLFENEIIKVWTIKLEPNASLPFHKHTRNYNWTALTVGTAISHYTTGRAINIQYEKGDLSFYDHDAKGDFVHNLKNIGDGILKFVTVEYKK